jgi:hypothetical protein
MLGSVSVLNRKGVSVGITRYSDISTEGTTGVRFIVFLSRDVDDRKTFRNFMVRKYSQGRLATIFTDSSFGLRYRVGL